MKDVHIRGALLILLGVLCVGSAIWARVAGLVSDAPILLGLVGIVAFVAAIFILVFVES